VGLAYVFEDMVSELVSEKRLVRVLDRYCPHIPGYFLYYPSRLNLAPKLKVLIDFLKQGRGRGKKYA
jgi:DNA-binding transcriptional LysR family regulator